MQSGMCMLKLIFNIFILQIKQTSSTFIFGSLDKVLCHEVNPAGWPLNRGKN
jgi:hypothetical protein